MKILKETVTKSGNKIQLIGNEIHKNILVIGVFHGDEPQGKFLIEEYLDKYPDTKLFFIPCLNPDGMSIETRTNANGVDLNRNFPTKNWELTEKNESFGGEFPACEIETNFLIDVINEIKPDIITEIGITNLGKYTFPKTTELLMKVFEILEKQLEKYSHIAFPDR